MELDYYKVLGVSRDAKEDVIKKEYRKIAKKYHPDANPDDETAAKKFKEAAKAYGVLGDKEKRRAYDKEMEAAQKAGSGPGAKKAAQKAGGQPPMSDFDFGNLSGNFEQFFGFRPKSGQVDGEKLKPNGKTKTNPIDTTELFERYMGIKK